jgi:hypothetical protein
MTPLMILMAGGQLAAAGMSASGQMQRSRNEWALTQRQATATRMQALHARDVGMFQEQQARLQAGHVRGAQEVAIASAGIDPTIGTPGLLRRETEALSALDAAMIRTNAMRQAWGVERQVELDLEYAQHRRRAQQQDADITMLGGLMGAGATLYGGR